MDRDETLRRLDRMINDTGAVALLHDTHPPGPDNAWHEPYRALLARYAAGDSGTARTRAPDWLRHEVILLRSPFRRVEEIGVYDRRPLTADRLIERALSMSSTSRARLGPDADRMVADLRALLPTTPFTELVLSQAVLATRP